MPDLVPMVNRSRDQRRQNSAWSLNDSRRRQHANNVKLDVCRSHVRSGRRRPMDSWQDQRRLLLVAPDGRSRARSAALTGSHTLGETTRKRCTAADRRRSAPLPPAALESQVGKRPSSTAHGHDPQANHRFAASSPPREGFLTSVARAAPNLAAGGIWPSSSRIARFGRKESKCLPRIAQLRPVYCGREKGHYASQDMIVPPCWCDASHLGIADACGDKFLLLGRECAFNGVRCGATANIRFTRLGHEARSSHPGHAIQKTLRSRHQYRYRGCELFRHDSVSISTLSAPTSPRRRRSIR